MLSTLKVGGDRAWKNCHVDGGGADTDLWQFPTSSKHQTESKPGWSMTFKPTIDTRSPTHADTKVNLARELFCLSHSGFTRATQIASFCREVLLASSMRHVVPEVKNHF